MLNATILWTTTEGVESVIFLDIANIGGGRRADYKLKLYTGSHSICKSALLRGYARWTEPALGLVARAICLAYFESGTLPSIKVPSIGITNLVVAVELVAGGVRRPQQLESIQVIAQGALGVLEHFSEVEQPTSTEFILCDGDSNPCHLAVRAICRALFGTNSPPLVPIPFNPPVHEHNNVKYVRLAEIPEPARGAFSRRLNGSTIPCIPHEQRENVAYSWDWDSFVGN